jgi:hypothetical protein
VGWGLEGRWVSGCRLLAAGAALAAILMLDLAISAICNLPLAFGLAADCN